jgi:hypothetical protein
MKLGNEHNDEESRLQDKGRHGCISFPKFDLNLHLSAALSIHSNQHKPTLGDRASCSYAFCSRDDPV